MYIFKNINYVFVISLLGLQLLVPSNSWMTSHCLNYHLSLEFQILHVLEHAIHWFPILQEEVMPKKEYLTDQDLGVGLDPVLDPDLDHDLDHDQDLD